MVQQSIEQAQDHLNRQHGKPSGEQLEDQSLEQAEEQAQFCARASGDDQAEEQRGEAIERQSYEHREEHAEEQQAGPPAVQGWTASAESISA